MSRSKDETALTRRRFLGGLAAAAAAPSLIALGQADAATAKAKKKPAPAKPAPKPADGPDYSVAKTPEERAALERQWKQTIETLEALRKVPVPVGSEFATGALAPLKLRRGEA